MGSQVILVNSKVGAIYQKKRPFVIGNGFDPLHILIEQEKSLNEVEIDASLKLDAIPDKENIISRKRLYSIHV